MNSRGNLRWNKLFLALKKHLSQWKFPFSLFHICSIKWKIPFKQRNPFLPHGCMLGLAVLHPHTEYCPQWCLEGSQIRSLALMAERGWHINTLACYLAELNLRLLHPKNSLCLRWKHAFSFSFSHPHSLFADIHHSGDHHQCWVCQGMVSQSRKRCEFAVSLNRL